MHYILCRVYSRIDASSLISGHVSTDKLSLVGLQSFSILYRTLSQESREEVLLKPHDEEVVVGSEVAGKF